MKNRIAQDILKLANKLVAREQFFNDSEDIEWVKEVHLPKNVPSFKSFIIYGNEDAPEKIELFEEKMPHYKAEPIFVWTENGRKADDDMPDAVKDLAEDLGVELDEVDYTDEGDYYRVELDGEEWMVFDDYDAAEQYAIDRIKEDLEDEPGIFNQSFIESHVYITDTDKRLIANDFADMLRESLEDEGLLEDEIEEQTDERYEEVKKALDDPIEFFVNEEGIYTQDELLKQNFISIDYDVAAQEAVNIDGVAHFLSTYDGNETELDSGAVAYRTN